jgi:chromosome segregation ATPase
MTTLTRSQCRVEAEADKSAPFLCMRLMCSQDRTEVEGVKNELFKAGILAETRNNPVAEALGVSGIELWVQDERDFFNAAKLYARMQDRTSRKSGALPASPVVEFPGLRANASRAEADGAEDLWQRVKVDETNPSCEQRHEQLEQASSLLETEIEEMLERESELAGECEALRSKVNQLSEALSKAQSALARETDCRAAAEREQAEKVSALTTSLEQARQELARAEAQFAREKSDLQQQFKSRDDLLAETQKKLESKSQLLQKEQGALAEVRKELQSLEQARGEHEKSMAEARSQVAAEREARIAAEERADKAVASQRFLEAQLRYQKELEQQMQAHVASLNALCSRLHAKRVTRGDPQ